MYIPEVQNEKNSNELPVFIYRKSYKGYFCIFRGPKEILRGPKKQSSCIGSFTPHPYTYTFTPTFNINYQIYPLYKTQHNTLSLFTLPFLKKTVHVFTPFPEKPFF